MVSSGEVAAVDDWGGAGAAYGDGAKQQPSSSTPTSVTRSRPGTGTPPNARCERKTCSPRPMRSSGVRAVLYLRTVRECSTRIAASSDGMDPVPSTSATDRSNRGRPESTMVSSGEVAAVDDWGGRARLTATAPSDRG